MRRTQQHQAGRRAAAQALQCLGLAQAQAQAPLGRLPTGAPAWPTTVVGSITHTAWASHAVVGWIGQGRALGIDSQVLLDADSAMELSQLIANRHERSLLAQQAPPRLAMTLLFSAKEAFYKALNIADARAREFHTVCLVGLHEADQPSGWHGAPPTARPPTASPRCWALQLQPAAWLNRGACWAWVVDDGLALHCTVAFGHWPAARG